ncbi:Uncharacterised protein [Helicobacter fennelliae]|uniref:Periplasmic protein n=1 Tax=Helicobacter fennelliae TaxID=215 RepID=A0A2X3DYE5_9HELI|nr:hypothetical protein [Helicobacter fennelliae]SQC36282.1 Uncharacterised protein [Helicobacter fennelliae]
MKSLKIVGLSVLLASSLSLLNALDISGLVGATKDLVDNTSDIASGKKQKEEEAKKKAEENARTQARAKKDAEEKNLQENLKTAITLCKKEYHKQKVAYTIDSKDLTTAQSNPREFQLFWQTDGMADTRVWDRLRVEPKKYKLAPEFCGSFYLDTMSDSEKQAFRKETAKYKK